MHSATARQLLLIDVSVNAVGTEWNGSPGWDCRNGCSRVSKHVKSVGFLSWVVCNGILTLQTVNFMYHLYQ